MAICVGVPTGNDAVRCGTIPGDCSSICRSKFQAVSQSMARVACGEPRPSRYSAAQRKKPAAR
ncbi:MAG: hypothetical protein IPH09_11155 [bacterium]|nr:hypothetical protein [bacterium]